MNKPLRNFLLIGGAVFVAAAGGAYVARSFGPVGQPQTNAPDRRRPIIQIVREQPGFPSLADTIASLCPSIAAIVPVGSTTPVAAGFAISPTGWILAATGALPSGDIEVHLGAGPALAVSETRSDPVSGLSIVKTGATGLAPVPFADQSYPRIGDFGVAIANPAASGCSAEAAMIASDFLTDGGAPSAYIRLQPIGAALPPGAPFISGAGQAVGVVAPSGPAASAIPADVVADIVDELLRGSLSPTTRFAFRAEDFDTTLAGRLGNSRSTGTVVALVQPKSPAARAGLQAGDIVVAVNGSPVASASELGRSLDGAGKTVTMDVARRDERLTLAVAKVPGS